MMSPRCKKGEKENETTFNILGRPLSICGVLCWKSPFPHLSPASTAAPHAVQNSSNKGKPRKASHQQLELEAIGSPASLLAAPMTATMTRALRASWTSLIVRICVYLAVYYFMFANCVRNTFPARSLIYTNVLAYLKPRLRTY